MLCTFWLLISSDAAAEKEALSSPTDKLNFPCARTDELPSPAADPTAAVSAHKIILVIPAVSPDLPSCGNATEGIVKQNYLSVNKLIIAPSLPPLTLH